MALTDAFIGLGSNLENPVAQLARAIAELATLPNTKLAAQSPFYRSKPLGPQDQPDFINGCAWLKTSLPPLELLDQLQAIELAHGRERVQHWGPRTLDLDLLLYGNRVIDHPRLHVPHPELPDRDFVLRPLLDLNPHLALPDGRYLSELLGRCPDNRLQRLEPARNPGSLPD
ncbi:MAG TPA: 2-amino-4-hydroxy-6-hydroxymethyldihydropteridine diphosphokinase [Marinobacter sp.]|jgi:2-amino-4-hydroxy-6-hydroxymethyldihydropteridine diphosphokinase|nr:2-amino-4-hydroxy-6-hydroxymethyldihydropteridine diphosphokinase [Marinobacter sp.]